MRPSLRWHWYLFERLEAFRGLPDELLQPLNDPDLEAIRTTIRATNGSLEETLGLLEERHADAAVRYAVNRVLRVTAQHVSAMLRHAGGKLGGESSLLDDAVTIDKASAAELLPLLRGLTLNDQMGVEYDDEELNILPDLLALSPGTDPIAWSRSQKLAECARYSLRAAVDKSLLRRTDMLGGLILAVGVSKPNQLVIEGQSVEMRVTEVELREFGIAVAVEIAPGLPNIFLQRWTGFDVVRDAAGAGYVQADYSANSNPELGMRTRLAYFSGRVFEGTHLSLRAGTSMIEAIDNVRYSGVSYELKAAPIEFDVPVTEAIERQLKRL